MAGRRPPIQWPDGARIAIIPCVAFETWPDDLGTIDSLQNESRRLPPRNATTKMSLGSLTDRQFGERVGIFRMLDLFQREGIKTTFFLNGINVERLPDIVKEIRSQGHELASENYIHDYSFMKTYEQEQEDLRKTVSAFQAGLGERPLGYLSTGVAPSVNTPKIIAEEGYFYWMDPQHDELPYTLKVGDKSLVVLTYLNSLNDYSSFKNDERTPRELLGVWIDTFDYLWREGAERPAFVAWGLHPFLSGRPYRTKVLEEFLHYAKGFPGVWFARGIDVARWWWENYRDTHVEEWPNYKQV